jgi:hypothetical protein
MSHDPEANELKARFLVLSEAIERLEVWLANQNPTSFTIHFDYEDAGDKDEFLTGTSVTFRRCGSTKSGGSRGWHFTVTADDRKDVRISEMSINFKAAFALRAAELLARMAESRRELLARVNAAIAAVDAAIDASRDTPRSDNDE